jgi:protease I
MNPLIQTAPADTGLTRIMEFETPVTVPTLSTELLATADGELNRELHSFLFDPPENRQLLEGRKIAICCTNGVEQIELVGAHRWLTERGAIAHVVAPKAGPYPPTYGIQMPPMADSYVLTIRLMVNSGWVKIDQHLETARAGDYDAALVPGGCWNPDILRMDKNVHAFLQALHAAGKPVCAICHGPWVLINANLVKGRKATGIWNIHADLQNAGATVIDEPVVVDGNLMTARFPYDLPRLMKALAAQLVG